MMSKIFRVREEWKNAPIQEDFINSDGSRSAFNDPYPNRFLKVQDFPNNPVQIFEEVEVPDA